MRFQEFLLRTFHIVEFPTLNRLANAHGLSVDERMNRTCSSVSLACGADDPNRLPSRPFLNLSSQLSWFVPRNRWSGRTHDGLSHLCRTSRVPGSPCAMIQLARCALRMLSWLLTRKNPYPSSSTEQIQTQHGPSSGTCTGTWPSLLTFFQNLFSGRLASRWHLREQNSPRFARALLSSTRKGTEHSGHVRISKCPALLHARLQNFWNEWLGFKNISLPHAAQGFTILELIGINLLWVKPRTSCTVAGRFLFSTFLLGFNQ